MKCDMACTGFMQSRRSSSGRAAISASRLARYAWKISLLLRVKPAPRTAVTKRGRLRRHLTCNVVALRTTAHRAQCATRTASQEAQLLRFRAQHVWVPQSRNGVDASKAR